MTEKVTVELLDGREATFRLSMAGLNRLAERTGQPAEELVRSPLKHSVSILWEAMIEKGSTTEQELAELLPAHLDIISETIVRLMLGKALPSSGPPTASLQ